MRSIEEIPAVPLSAGSVPLSSAKLFHLVLLGAALGMAVVLALAFLYLIRTAGRPPSSGTGGNGPRQDTGTQSGSSDVSCLYHPFFRSGTSKAAGCEVLTRPKVQGDAQFCVFQTCCQWAAARADSGLIACCLDKDILAQEDIAEELIRLANEAGAERGRIMIETGQDCSEEHRTAFRASAARLKQAGFWLCLDNFGRGGADLAGLAELAPDAVKLDESLIQTAGETGRAVFCGAVQLVKGTGASVICSGIETAEQCAAAEAAGCDYLQGAYFCKPLNEKVFAQFLADCTFT